MEIKPQNGVQYLTGLVEKLQKENEVYKTMLESSQGTTQAWVDKFNELEKKYDQALTVISSKKIMEMQEENKNLQADLKQANALLQWEEEYKKVLMKNSVVRSEIIEKYEKALRDIIKLGQIGTKYESLEAQIAKEVLEG